MIAFGQLNWPFGKSGKLRRALRDRDAIMGTALGDYSTPKVDSLDKALDLATRAISMASEASLLRRPGQWRRPSLFRILTKAYLSAASANPREPHIGVAKVPDDRLDRLAALYNPKKFTHTSVEYVDWLAYLGQADNAGFHRKLLAFSSRLIADVTRGGKLRWLFGTPPRADDDLLRTNDGAGIAQTTAHPDCNIRWRG